MGQPSFREVTGFGLQSIRYLADRSLRPREVSDPDPQPTLSLRSIVTLPLALRRRYNDLVRQGNRSELGLALPPTNRQFQILGSYIRSGAAEAAARRLGISKRTVQSHLAILRERLGAHNEAQAVHLLWLAYWRHARRCAVRRHIHCSALDSAAYFREVGADV